MSIVYHKMGHRFVFSGTDKRCIAVLGESDKTNQTIIVCVSAFNYFGFQCTTIIIMLNDYCFILEKKTFSNFGYCYE